MCQLDYARPVLNRNSIADLPLADTDGSTSPDGRGDCSVATEKVEEFTMSASFHSAELSLDRISSNRISSAAVGYAERMNEIELASSGERLRWARERAGFKSKAAAAKAVKMNEVSYRALENDQHGLSKHAADLAKCFKVPVEWLLEGGPLPSENRGAGEPSKGLVEGNSEPGDPPALINAADAAAENVVSLRSFDLSYSMGPGTNIDDYVEEEEFQFDAGMLSKLTRAPADRLFVARGEGDSMFPTLLNEDTIVIDTTQTVVNLRDRIWACSIYGAGAIKRLRPAAGGKMEVISDNPAIKDDLVDAQDIHIIGRVIWLGRRV